MANFDSFDRAHTHDSFTDAHAAQKQLSFVDIMKDDRRAHSKADCKDTSQLPPVYIHDEGNSNHLKGLVGNANQDRDLEGQMLRK